MNETPLRGGTVFTHEPSQAAASVCRELVARQGGSGAVLFHASGAKRLVVVASAGNGGRDFVQVMAGLTEEIHSELHRVHRGTAQRAQRQVMSSPAVKLSTACKAGAQVVLPW